jgi:ATPase subunit of ABC transporter with duplicated ATPase domains
MMSELAELNARSRTSNAKIDFSATNRQTKDLIGLAAVTCTIGERTLFKGVSFNIKAGMRVGLAGPNRSGKTTLLRLFEESIATAGRNVRRSKIRRSLATAVFSASVSNWMRRREMLINSMRGGRSWNKNKAE